MQPTQKRTNLKNGRTKCEIYHTFSESPSLLCPRCRPASSHNTLSLSLSYVVFFSPTKSNASERERENGLSVGELCGGGDFKYVRPSVPPLQYIFTMIWCRTFSYNLTFCCPRHLRTKDTIILNGIVKICKRIGGLIVVVSGWASERAHSAVYTGNGHHQ